MTMLGLTGGMGFTGGKTGSRHTGLTGLVGPTGLQGVTGPFVTRVSEDEWENPIRSEDNHDINFKVKGILHCAFGPAITRKDKSTYWYIKGNIIDGKNVKIMKSILADIKLAPLYLNDPLFKYTARWVLKNFNGKPE